MKQLLNAVAAAWAQAGHEHLAGEIKRTIVPDVLSVAGRNVPQNLARDYRIALNAMQHHPALRRQLEGASTQINWAKGGMTMPESFRDRYCYCELAGPNGMVHTPDIRFGIYLQARDTDYPKHWHKAREHYLVLSGTALWQVDDCPYAPHRPAEAFEHLENQPHATRTSDEPMLALWFWQGDIRMETYKIVGVDS